MKQNKKEIKEPFPPEKTPNPPQIIDPNQRKKEELSNNKPEDQLRANPQPTSQTSQENSGGRKLLDDDADIQDETTI